MVYLSKWWRNRWWNYVIYDLSTIIYLIPQLLLPSTQTLCRLIRSGIGVSIKPTVHFFLMLLQCVELWQTVVREQNRLPAETE